MPRNAVRQSPAARHVSTAANMTVASRLRQGREDAGLTRAELSDKAKVSARTIEKYEYGTSEPTLQNLKRLCRALNIGYDELMAEVDVPEIIPVRTGRRPSGDIREQLTAIVNQLGGTVRFGNRSDPTPDVAVSDEDEVEEQSPGATALIDLREKVEDKGLTPRSVRGRLAHTETLLKKLDADELVALAAEVEYKIPEDLLPAKPAKPGVAHASADEDAAAEALSRRLLLAMLYPDFDELSPEALSQARDHLESAYPDFPVPGQRSWFDSEIGSSGESDEAFAARLRADFPSAMIEAVRNGKPFDLSSTKKSPRASSDDNGSDELL